jgi:protein phosphatase
VIDVPVPGLVVLVGAAGAGKSTLAARLFDPAEILSSDALRAAVSGDPADQRVTRTAFAILHREARKRLLTGRLVVVDATNVERAARLQLLRLARESSAPAIAIAILPDPAVVHARNTGRPGRPVPVAIVERHLAAIAGLGRDPAAARAALLAEGFTAVHVATTTDDIDGFAVTRVVRPPRP